MNSDATAKRMWILDSPVLGIPAANLVNGATGMVDIPVPSYLIECERGLVLFDTGIAPAASDDPESVFGAALEHMTLEYPAERKIQNQIENLGFSLDDVTHVVTSHSHFDHCGGLFLFPRAKHYIGAGEIRWAYWPDPPGVEHFDGHMFDTLRDADWTYIPKGANHSLFGDGSVTILSTPGHTPGELSMSVRLPSQNFILTGDTVHMRESLTDLLPGPVDYNSREAIESIMLLKRLAESEQARLLISHDPEDWAEFPHAPEAVR